MRKKWLALALSMAMVVGSITGCGGSDSNKDASNSSKSNDSAKVETVADGAEKFLTFMFGTQSSKSVLKSIIRITTKIHRVSVM